VDRRTLGDAAAVGAGGRARVDVRGRV